MPWIELLPWLATMLVLLCASAFFSASEAALFYLRRRDRQAFQAGSRSQRTAAHLLDDPDRLLGAVLFWNLCINIVYFAIASILALQAEGALAAAIGLGSLFTLIFCSELLPKSMAVIQPRTISALVSLPLSVAVRAVDPVLPIMRTVNVLSRRLLWPGFEPEPYLQVTDLERAIQVSGADEVHRTQEQIALQNLISLSELRVDQMMRPRTHLVTFRPPVSLSDLQGRLPPSGYLLVTEPESDEITHAVPLRYLSGLPSEHLERYAAVVEYVPWCTSASFALELMRKRDCEVVVVVNEYGETIGILTFNDLLHAVFAESPSRFARLFQGIPIQQVQPGCWRVSGMASVWRLARFFNVKLPEAKSVTMAGVVQEVLGRLPQQGDRGVWGDFEFEVLEAPELGQVMVELRLVGRAEVGG